MSTEICPAVPAPPDASEVSDWSQCGLELLKRPFFGSVREVSGFRVRVEGVQRENGSCARRVVVASPSSEVVLEPEAVRQLSAALSAAADEIEALQ